jgi:hypothetical protein
MRPRSDIAGQQYADTSQNAIASGDNHYLLVSEYGAAMANGNLLVLGATSPT